MQDSFGTFELKYILKTIGDYSNDIQFGMDFVLTQKNQYSLCQVILPATAVGNNPAGIWSVDNHKQPGTVESLIFNGADKGIINDRPTELSKPDRGILTTRFVVFIVDIKKACIYTNGVTFGYNIDTSAIKPVTDYLRMKEFNMIPEQEFVIKEKCKFIKLIKPNTQDL